VQSQAPRVSNYIFTRTASFPPFRTSQNNLEVFGKRL